MRRSLVVVALVGCSLPEGDYFGRTPASIDPAHFRWCNQGEPDHLDPTLASSTVSQQLVTALFDGLTVYGADGLPFNTRFGNGDPIGEDIVQLLNSVYEANTAREPWQAGDLMLVDNVRTAHSREPFEGPREVLVAMADPVRLADCSPTVEVTAR